MSSGLFKAVCYRCSYEGPGRDNRCPVCQFPMILEPESTPPGGRSIEDIFARASLRDGAPPLPGVHVEKRKAQMLAEARRERLESQRQGKLDFPLPVADGAASLSLSSVKIPRFRYSALKWFLFCASALAAGALAAALQIGAL